MIYQKSAHGYKDGTVTMEKQNGEDVLIVTATTGYPREKQCALDILYYTNK
jgi:hypothetical protein